MNRSTSKVVAQLVAVVWVCVLSLIATQSVGAQSSPAPDPAGIATGDKTSVVDAAGNAFVVAEPTDKAAPDYAEKKKAFDEYQARSANRWR